MCKYVYEYVYYYNLLYMNPDVGNEYFQSITKKRKEYDLWSLKLGEVAPASAMK